MTVGGLSSRADRLHRKLANIEARRGIVERADADKTKEAQDKRKRLERFAGEGLQILRGDRSAEGFPPFWHTPRAHRDNPAQRAYVDATSRFRINHSGRRSGKTWLTKGLVFAAAALANTPWPDPRFFLGAPTERQARRIFWQDTLNAFPDEFVAHVSISEACLTLVNGASIWIIGFDKPARFEGPPWDGGDLDEYADMKEATWLEHVYPALADREGFCMFTGVPNGRNHFYRLRQRHQSDDAGRWTVHNWHSNTVLPGQTIDDAQADSDDLTYRQEFGGEFIAMEGSAYYSYSDELHLALVEYSPKLPLIFAFDFNVSPGIALVAQEQRLPNGNNGTAWVDEVWIARNSTTPLICHELLKRYEKHPGPVVCYGDATGGAGGTSSIMGSDWDLIEDHLRPVFANHLEFVVPSSNPRVRARVNSLCHRLKAANGNVAMAINPDTCPRLVEDLEGVQWNKDGTDLDDSDPMRTHMTDAVGYYTASAWPVVTIDIGTSEMLV